MVPHSRSGQIIIELLVCILSFLFAFVVITHVLSTLDHLQNRSSLKRGGLSELTR